MVTHSGSPGAVRAAGRLRRRLRCQAEEPVRASRARAINYPRSAVVEARVDGTPVRVNRQAVAVLREEWRVVDRWWTEEPIARRYFEVVLESGENTVVFHDGSGGGWFTQRGA